MYEHVIRIPQLVRVPEAFGGTKARRAADWLWVNVDLAPTLLEFAGLAPPECDGLSARAALTGGAGAASRDYVIGQYYGKRGWVNPIRMIRTRDAKLVRYLGRGEELYDLAEDPDELANRADDPRFAARKRELGAELDRWIAEHADPFYSLGTTLPGS
jgi:arylsulfatase A-like enzyme